MGSPIFRRLMISAGITALAGAAVYAMTGTSGAATAPQHATVHAAGPVRGEVIETKVVHGVRKTVRVGPVTVKTVQLGATTTRMRPDISTVGPNEVCLSDVYASNSATAGTEYTIEFVYPGYSPFVTGSGFVEEHNRSYYAEQTLFAAGEDIYVSVLNNGSSTETLSGFYEVQWYPPSGTTC